MTLEEEIRDVMETVQEVDPVDNATILAEECCWIMGHDEWLDDDDHVVWEIALDFFDD